MADRYEPQIVMPLPYCVLVFPKCELMHVRLCALIERLKSEPGCGV